MIAIDKNIPPPTTGAKGNKYPIEALEVGDSFFVPGKRPAEISACYFRKALTLRRKFTARTLEENGVKGCRVWRIA